MLSERYYPIERELQRVLLKYGDQVEGAWDADIARPMMETRRDYLQRAKVPPFPTTSYGFAHNLTPELQEKVKEAFLTFDWSGTALIEEFGKQADKFCGISFEKEWKPIRIIQKENGIVYTEAALSDLKVKKKKK